jgi:hypothetical protein
MVQAYNFLGSWQLIPEKGQYTFGERPKSGTFRISSSENEPAISIEQNWVSIENQAFATAFSLCPDGQKHAFSATEQADSAEARFIDGITLAVSFTISGQTAIDLRYEIMPNGYLRITRSGLNTTGNPYTNIEFYHRQLNVLPYAASVSGAVIRPTEEGMIRHKALTAMEEQTQMQLEQIRKQIELLALQAQEIHKRRELSLLIYGARINFSPVIGQVYYLYEKKDASHMLSLVSPKEWGGGAGPFKSFVAAVKLLADHTWMEVF